jgi:hypothetical protein
MRIDGTARSGAAGAAGRARRSDGGHTFELGGATRSSDTRAAVATQSLPGLDALLALQMVDDPVAGRRRGVRRGRAILDALDSLKLSLLSGRLPGRDLTRLIAAVEGRERDSEDPRLEAVLDEIELRARVELAKLGSRRA